MNTHIISIGDELLIGQVVNTNASWIAGQLDNSGYETGQIVTVPDNRNSILETLENIAGKIDTVIITGGLGPTKDDITKSVICEFTGTELVFNADVFENIKSIFHKRGMEVSETNRKQAEVPAVCRILQNGHGTAPGLWFEKKGTVFIALPGVPFEMKFLITEKVIPELLQKFSPATIVHKSVLVHGIPESHLSDRLENWEHGLKTSGLKLAYLPQPGIIKLRISYAGINNEHISEIIQNHLDELRKIIPDNIFGYDDDSIEQIIGELLTERGATVSAAESCSGGKIASMITSVPGSSQYFKGSVIAYANDVKIHLLNVKPANISKLGAVSREVAEEMAIGSLHLFHSDYSVATSGIAGPDGGTPEKPVGTVWIAVASKHGAVSEKFVFGKSRETNITRTSVTALNMLMKIIKGL